MKICSKCKIEKSILEFYKDKSKKDGYKYICKHCLKSSNLKFREQLIFFNLKKCSQCHKILNIKNFYKDISRKDKLSNTCKLCSKIFCSNYQKINRKQINSYSLKYYHLKEKNNLDNKITRALRTRLYHAIKNNLKSKKTQDLLGCSIENLKFYLKNKFQYGMTWDNHTIHGWHIDHIKPCASFDLSKPEEQKRCFHYTNLQPLWSKDNLKKGQKLCLL